MKKSEHLTYRCANSVTNARSQRHSIQIAASGVERDVSKYVIQLLLDISIVEQALKKYIENHSSQESIESYDNAIKEIKKQREEIAKDIRSVRGYAKELLLNQLTQLEGEVEKLEEHKEGIK